MNQMHPTIAASIAGFAPRFIQTSCSQCGKSLGPGNAGVSRCDEHRVPMHTHCTTTGEGDARVECRFDIDEDGDISTMQVYMDGEGKNIFKALTVAQVEKLDAECLAAAEADYREHKDDARIDAYIERMAA
jgi:hypothetical protein